MRRSYAAHPGNPWGDECDCGIATAPEVGDQWRITVAEGAGLVFAVCLADGRVRLLATNVYDHEVVLAVLAHLPTPGSLPEASRALAGLADVDDATLDTFMADAAAYRTADEERDATIYRAGFVCCEPAALPASEAMSTLACSRPTGLRSAPRQPQPYAPAPSIQG
jgi:hypothetical protein